MSELQPSAIEQNPGVLGRVAEFVDHGKAAGAVVLSGLGLGAVATSIEGFVGESAAAAQAPAAHEIAATSRTRQVEEYASVIAKTATGATITGAPTETFVFVEQCKDGSKKVSRKVIYNKKVQPLGDCNVGSQVTVTEGKPLSGNWQNKSAAKITLKATRNNNHRFVFTEQEQAEPAQPAPTTTTPTTAPAPPVEPAPAPGSPVTPPPPPPPATPSQTIKVHEVALDGSGATIPTPANTFEYDWACNGVDEGIVTVSSDPQVLGSCLEGQTVTITEEAPLGAQKWTELSTSPQLFNVGSSAVEATFQDQEVTTPPPPGDPYTSGEVGVDISWPQCIGNEGPPSFDFTGDDFGIVGVNDGLGYSTNPCLEGEATDFPANKLSLYVNTGWNVDSAHNTGTSPKACAAGDFDCEAYDYGYNAGLYAYNAALNLDVTSPTWWLDVETDNTWSTDTTQNQNSLQGEYDALKASGATTVGPYSTTAQWDSLTGSWINNWPSYGATTWTTSSEAATYCTGHEFTGGPSYLMQFTPTPELDQDYAC